MTTTQRVRTPRSAQNRRTLIAFLAAVFIASMAGLSAHVVKGVIHPTLATAFVSSPSVTQDSPIKILWDAEDTRLRVVCFNAANTSPARLDDPDWPRVTAVGFELPGALSGFSLMEPLGGDWELVEGTKAAIPGHEPVTLDFAIIARVNPAGLATNGTNALLGVPPGQPRERGSGTRFCVSGPFPDTLPLPNPSDPTAPLVTTIELIINGVVVGFHRIQPAGPSIDVGVWDSPMRAIPLYPE